MNLRRIKAGVLTAILLGGAVAAPTAAYAGSSLCGAAQACVYLDPNFVGLAATRSGGGGLYNVSASIDNRTSSWENKTASNGAWYTESMGGGSCFTMSSAREDASIAWPNYDKLTSWKMNGAC
ncbi:MAG: peptidase inhibitor family I36 protein [Cellulomonas sp.]